MRQKIEEGKMAKQVAHQETTNSINDGHWRRKITKNCWQEIKVNRNNNGEKKIIEKHCSKRFNKDLSTRQRDDKKNEHWRKKVEQNKEKFITIY